jgi:hypothetical protein
MPNRRAATDFAVAAGAVAQTAVTRAHILFIKTVAGSKVLFRLKEILSAFFARRRSSVFLHELVSLRDPLVLNRSVVTSTIRARAQLAPRSTLRRVIRRRRSASRQAPRPEQRAAVNLVETAENSISTACSHAVGDATVALRIESDRFQALTRRYGDRLKTKRPGARGDIRSRPLPRPQTG